MRRKTKRVAQALQDKLEREAARERAEEAEALRRRGYLTANGHFPWRVPDDLLDLYRAKYSDLRADVPWKFDAQIPGVDAKASSPAKPARKRATKKAATRTTKATT